MICFGMPSTQATVECLLCSRYVLMHKGGSKLNLNLNMASFFLKTLMPVLILVGLDGLLGLGLILTLTLILVGIDGLLGLGLILTLIIILVGIDGLL